MFHLILMSLFVFGQVFGQAFSQAFSRAVYPTVLLHGVLADTKDTNTLKLLLEENFKIDVYNIEIGNGAPTSIFTSMNHQLDVLCNEIYNIKQLESGFNFVGMSQGGILARGYVEYCNKFPVRNLITLASPNGGVFYNTTVASNFYEPLVQSTLSVADYWRDPYRYDVYLSNSTYLAQLNQEHRPDRPFNNLDVLENFVMVWSPFDEVIMPPESSKFSLLYVADDWSLFSRAISETAIYKSGKLGLKNLDEQGRLVVFPTDCKHGQHIQLACFPQLKPLFEKYLL